MQGVEGMEGERGFENLYPEEVMKELHANIKHALDEDAGKYGDITALATISPDAMATARFLAKADGTVAGIKVAEMVMTQVHKDLKCTWSVKDGDRVKNGQYFGDVHGPAQALLVAERIALNMMQRMSGTATATAAMIDAMGKKSKTQVLDTRKTVPGLRYMDKIAHRLGGGTSHRWGLYDMVMIKDNHITASGGLIPAVNKVKEYLTKIGRLGAVAVEVECGTLEQVGMVAKIVKDDAAAAAAAKAPANKKQKVDRYNPKCRIHRVMLDNMVKPNKEGTQFDVTMVLEAMKILKGTDVQVEVSGNVTLASIASIAATKCDFISSGTWCYSFSFLSIMFGDTVK